MSDDDQPTVPWTEEQPRFLAGSGRHGNYKRLPDGRWQYVEPPEDTEADHGYSGTPYRALPNEPECIGPAILESYVQVNARIMTQHLILEVAAAQQTRAKLTPQNRLDTVRARAKGAHVDLSHPIHLVQREIDKARLRERPVKDNALVRLAGLEELLDGVSIQRLAT